MRVTLSAAISLDGYLDDSSQERLRLSSAEDWVAIERMRSEFDAILVGAGTVRADDPSLVIDDAALRAQRRAHGQGEDIVKVTLTASGRLDAESKFFTRGQGDKIVFAHKDADQALLDRVREMAEVVVMEQRITARRIVDQLSARGYNSLLVEGGTGIHSLFLQEGVVDELRLAIAPFFVGQSDAPRLVNDGQFLWNKDNRAELRKVEMLGDMAVMHYSFCRSGIVTK